MKGPGEVTGSKLEANNVEILNKELVLFTMMDNASLEMELQIDLGRGYVPAEVNEKYIEEIGTIPLDANFPQSDGLSMRLNRQELVKEAIMTNLFSKYLPMEQ